MKLTLILLVCFVGATYQQGYAWSPFYDPYSPRIFLNNNYDQINRHQLTDKSTLQIETRYNSDADEIDSSIPNIEPRTPFGNYNKKAQNKFFVTSILPNSFFNFKPLTVTTLTSTVISTISSTAVIATVQSCLPSTMFVTTVGFVQLTTACARRRRDIDDEYSPRQITAEISDLILPSLVLPLATSSVASDYERYHVNPEIASSQTDLEEDQPQFVKIDKNNGRQHRALSLLVTVTSTSTLYSFSTTTIKKTINLSGPQQLSCLPSGFAVC
uniref:Uncharacterized protein n=1 Tax=Daphnia galeata TaxID=27404 RepID=A0A8J2RNQ4_9CRUS|nr:unnamed protein product [Daphnia galeata]